MGTRNIIEVQIINKFEVISRSDIYDLNVDHDSYYSYVTFSLKRDVSTSNKNVTIEAHFEAAIDLSKVISLREIPVIARCVGCSMTNLKVSDEEIEEIDRNVLAFKETILIKHLDR